MFSTSFWSEVANSEVSEILSMLLVYLMNVNLDTLLLDGSVEDYEYLNKSRREVDGVDDRHEWNALKVLTPVPCSFFLRTHLGRRRLWMLLDLRRRSNSISFVFSQRSCISGISSSLAPGLTMP